MNEVYIDKTHSYNIHRIFNVKFAWSYGILLKVHLKTI